MKVSWTLHLLKPNDEDGRAGVCYRVSPGEAVLVVKALDGEIRVEQFSTADRWNFLLKEAVERIRHALTGNQRHGKHDSLFVSLHLLDGIELLGQFAFDEDIPPTEENIRAILRELGEEILARLRQHVEAREERESRRPPPPVDLLGGPLDEKEKE